MLPKKKQKKEREHSVRLVHVEDCTLPVGFSSGPIGLYDQILALF